MFTEQITRWVSKEFAEEVQKQIEKDYPGTSKVIAKNNRYAVFVTREYLDYCELYVKRNCKIKDKVYQK